MHTTQQLPCLFLAASLVLGGCSSRGDAQATDNPASTTTSTAPTAAAASAAPPAAQAAEIFATRCTPCHGAEGRGDGAASPSLIPKPRNFHDRAWQASVNDDHLLKIIQYGGAAVGKSPTMPANPDLRELAVIQALAAHVRDLGSQP